MSQSVAVVAKLYQSVIDDVISNARESFLDEGVDEQVLQELKQIWEAKLLQSKAVEPPDAPDILQSGGDGNRQISNGQQTVVGQAPTNVTTAQFPPNQLVPVQINIPIQQGNTNGPQKSITVQVPASALQGGATQLQTVLSSPAVAAALALPPETAAAMLQQHINAAIQSGQLMAGHINFLPRIRLPDYRNYIRRPVIRPNPLSGRMMAHNLQCPSGQFAPVPKQVLPHSGIGQLDGPADTSDEDEEEDDDDDDDDEDRENEDKDQEENDYEGQDEEPLNSEDDVSDEDLSDLFDTDNVVVAQYDKITRSRNKWKFHLKDGIMNLQGRDYVFQKAGGDAEW